ncbi:hypothetical protein [Notoacmeibacter sp. MSK16QG-6]|uniref:hypothetical protein n=1 Tax=Notoacmeibacter sp. MSK16QG-6 TaxID=2957982 RepID=UPI0020A0BB1B|nr:hypothetical protein [Notoacmeibacter sp. MSK16QG-6]MCP1199425.1 hypothetical protein [Notoacmeibacter sp. MSK16QG-6]
MSVQKIQLGKLLRLMGSADEKRDRLLKKFIREDMRREANPGSGGDFHVPFWHDAKRHVNGDDYLPIMVAKRIAASSRRKRLYPELANGFLDFWNTKRRWTNKALISEVSTVHANMAITELGGIITVRNMMYLKADNNTERAYYPYFSEWPALKQNEARLGLWILANSGIEVEKSKIRILDLIRGNSISIADVGFYGNEREQLVKRYRRLIENYERIRAEIELTG